MISRIFLLSLLITLALTAYPNQRPIIGIYTQSDSDDEPNLSSKKMSATFQTYIAASYVRFIQMSGAQVVPIMAYSKQSQIAALLPKINGVLFPGGGVEFDMKTPWTSNANYILQYAMQQNDAGNVFPVWGTCLGFQLLSYLTANYENVLSPVRGQTAILNTIKFTDNTNKGYLFDSMPDRVITKLTTGQGITYYNHHYAVLRSTYDSNSRLNNFWRVVAQTTSSYNQKFVTVMEAKKYPFYAVQFHPQKSIFEWKVFSDKSYDSIEMVQILSNKFMDKARLSKNTFASFDEYQDVSIYNYPLSITTMSFTRIFLFNETKFMESPRENDLIGCDTIKIRNPDSAIYEQNWNVEKTINMIKEEVIVEVQ